MVKPIKFLTAILTIIGLFCCSKQNEETLLPGATISVRSPIAIGQYKYGDTIYVNATITGNEQLHGYEVSIQAAGRSDNLFFQHHHEHANPLQVAEKWKNNLTQPVDVEISAILDDRARKKSQTIRLRVSN